MKISVALAAYCGEKYIEDQIRSILAELPEDSEIVVSLDPSKDSTEEILSRLSAEDSRVRYITGSGRGLIGNFGNAISACTGDIIFLSDQDDIWLPGKVDAVCNAFSDPSVTVVMHDATITDGELKVIEPSLFAVRGRKEGIAANVIKNTWIGCCMAFRRELCSAILPFPDNIPMHDQWIGIFGKLSGKVAFIDKPFIYWRRHGTNSSSTSHSTVGQMIRWRSGLIRAVSQRRKELKNKKRAHRNEY